MSHVPVNPTDLQHDLPADYGKMRVTFEVACSIGAIVVTLAVSHMGFTHAPSAYLLLCGAIVFLGGILYMAHRFTTAETVVQACTLAEAFPLGTVVMVLVAWIIVSELTLGLGVVAHLDEDLFYALSGIYIVFILIGALANNYAFNVVMLFVGFLGLLFPSTNAHRIASTNETAVRVCTMILLYFIVTYRSSNVDTPTKDAGQMKDKTSIIMRAYGIVAMYRTTMVTWLLISPFAYAPVAIAIIIVHEIRYRMNPHIKFTKNDIDVLEEDVTTRVDAEQAMYNITMDME